MMNISTERTPALGPWLILAAILNLIWLSSGNFGPDLTFWTNWTMQLHGQGYVGYSANYPPIYVHWLTLVAEFYKFFNIPIETNQLFKSLTLTPVFVAHITLIAFIWKQLKKVEASPTQFYTILGLTVINPAILMNGPAWGQVDLLFALPLVLALTWLINGQRLLWIFPLLTIAVLLKFQSIALAPVFAALLWNKKKEVWKGIPIAVVIALFAILPFMLAGSAGQMFKAAYLESASTYPLASYNATNIWYLLGLNQMSDIRYLLDHSRNATGFELILTPKYLGMGSFVLLSLWLLWDTLKAKSNSRAWKNALLSVIGFFTLLPTMHERYMFLAVPVALAATVFDKRFFWIAVAITFANFLNTSLVMPPHDGVLAYGLSAGIVLLALVLLIGHKIPWAKINDLTGRFTFVYVAIALCMWGIQLGQETNAAIRVERAKDLPEGWLKATQIPERSSHQEWGNLHIDESVTGNLMQINGKRYAFGFGTHAPSTITIPIPKGALGFTTKMGVNDEAKGGVVKFIIKVDGVVRYESDAVEGGTDAREAKIPLNGEQVLELILDTHGGNEFDHADWAEPVFQVKTEE